MLARIFSILFLIITLLSCERWKQSPYKSKTVKPLKKTSKSLEYSLHSKDANLKEVKGIPGVYELTLYSVDTTVNYYFYDPNRKAGKITVDRFLQTWKNSFENRDVDIPNAAISYKINVHRELKKHFSAIPVILSNPKYEKEFDRFIFQARFPEKNVAQLGNLGEMTVYIYEKYTF